MLLTLFAPQGGAGSVALTATGISTGAPEVGTPQLNPPDQSALPVGGFNPRIVRRVVALNAIGIVAGAPALGSPALSARPSDGQIAAMIAAQNRAAQWADDEEAIAALLLAA
jgi:hypothetical protein